MPKEDHLEKSVKNLELCFEIRRYHAVKQMWKIGHLDAHFTHLIFSHFLPTQCKYLILVQLLNRIIFTYVSMGIAPDEMAFMIRLIWAGF